VRIGAFGGPEVLSVERVPGPAIGSEHTLIKVARAGVNFFDTEREVVR
jgi:NADPH:quinone reductase-like Zn-dependent oxidoreductase